MDRQPSCIATIMSVWPVMAYWATAITAFVKLLENGVVWYKAFGLSLVWPLALIDEIIRAVTVMT